MFDNNFLFVGKSIGKEKDWIKKKIGAGKGEGRGLRLPFIRERIF